MTTTIGKIGSAVRRRNGLLGGAAVLAALLVGATPHAYAQTEQQNPSAEAVSEESESITAERESPLLSINRTRESVNVPVKCAQGVRKDVELQPADASVTFGFNCLCGEDSNALKQAMMRYRDDYMRVYRKEITLEEMGTIRDYFSDAALPFAAGDSGGTELTMLLEPGEKQERTLFCYTAEDFKLIDDWAKYIIFGN